MRSCEDMSTLTINGMEQPFPQGLPATLADLLRQLGMDASTVVVEVDGKVVARGDFSATALGAGQSVELVRFVGGG